MERTSGVKRLSGLLLVCVLVFALITAFSLTAAALDVETVAVIGTEEYRSLEAALNAADISDVGVTIQIVKDMDLKQETYQILNANEQTITLDLNGHTITSSAGTPVFTLNGSLVMEDTAGGGMLKNTDSNGTLFLQSNGDAQLTILSGTYSAVTGFRSNAPYHHLPGTYDVTISGGAFNCSFEFDEVNACISGGKFKTDPTEFLAENVVAIRNQNSEDRNLYPYEVVSSHSHGKVTYDQVLPAGYTGGTLQSGNYVLQSNLTLQKAIEIPEGETVNLCLNGKLINIGTAPAAISNFGTLTIEDCDTVTTHYFLYQSGAAWVCDDANHTPGSVDLRAVPLSELSDATRKTGTVVAITGGCITGATASTIYSGNNLKDPSQAPSLTISAGTIVGNQTTGGGGLYVRNGTVTLGNCAICGNAATGDGGGIYTQGGTMNLLWCTICDNTSGNDGGGISNQGADINLYSGTITCNTASHDGGGIWSQYGTVELTGGSISKNSASGKGGGLYNSSTLKIAGNTTIYGNTTISGNTAKNGGGIYNDSQKVTITGGVVSGNTAGSSGGAIYNAQGMVELTGGTIGQNKADAGGSVYSDEGTVTVSENISVSGNTAQNGAGFYMKDASLTVSGGTITGNKAAKDGGGIYVATGGSLTISENASICGNTAANGAGVYMKGNTLTVSGGSITGNKASNDGGGIYNYTNPAVMTGGTISENTADAGAGIYLMAGSLQLSGGSISGNTATGQGGGIYSTGTVAISGTAAIADNTAEQGGGIMNWIGGTITMAAGTISGNTAKTSGGGIYNVIATVRTTGGSISGNTAKVYGGGLYNDGQSAVAELTGCTISENQTAGYGAGIYNTGSLTLKDTSVTGNTLTAESGVWKTNFGGAGIDWNGGTLTVAGKVVVQNNQTNGTADNLYMEFLDDSGDYPDNTPITIGADGLTEGSYIGVTHKMVPTAEKPIQVTNQNTEVSYFFSDDEKYAVQYVGGDQTSYLVLGFHTHDWHYTLSSDHASITVECRGTGNCSYSGTDRSVTLSAPAELTYDGQEKPATLSAETLVGETLTITYEKQGSDGTYQAMDAGAVPTEAGTYRASVTVGTGDAETTAYVVYTISEQQHDITIYRVQIPAAAHGTVTAEPEETRYGQPVTLTVTPDAGYELASLSVTDPVGQTVPVTENSDGTYTFDMPAGNVTVTVTFRQAGSDEPDEPEKDDYSTCPQDASCVYAKYTDSDPQAWYHDGVHYCVQNGLMNGVADTRFAPDAELSRAMLVTILYRMEGEPAFMGGNMFSDVEPGAWYEKAVVWANGQGIVEGYGDGTFGPNDSITREQLAVILYRYAKYRGVDTAEAEDTNILSYDDAADVSAWATTAMQWACGSGIINGIDGSLVPQGSATRAQAATMIQRFCENVLK